MQYRTFGKTGLSVSAIGLGTEYLIDLPQNRVIEVIHHAISQGINYFDLFFAPANDSRLPGCSICISMNRSFRASDYRIR